MENPVATGVDLGAEPCRVTVIGPRTRADLALPADVPLAYLLPTVLLRLDPQLADEGNRHDGWTLQRLGDPALDTGQTLEHLGVRHGEALYLRPRGAALPALAVDDIVDAVATGTAELPSRWGARSVRVTGLTAAVVAALLGLGVLATARTSWLIAALGVGVLLAGAGAFARGRGDRIGAVLGGLAVPYAFLAAAAFVAEPGAGSYSGHLLPGDLLSGGFGWAGAAGLLAGCAASALAGLLAAVAAGTDRAWYVAVAVAGGCGALGAAVTLRTDAAAGGAVVVSLGLLTAHLLPGLSVRLARLPRPIVPTRPSEVRQQPPMPDATAVDGGVGRADTYLTALVAGVATVVAAGAVPLAGTGGWAPVTVAGLAFAGLVLRARHFSAAAACGWLLGGAGVIAALLVRWLIPHLGGVLVTLGLLGLCLLAGALAHALPGRRLSPWWGRFGDIAEVLVTVAVLPVALQVLGVYGLVRAIGG
ncbi:type VII secretion integral membrane protein EccD [Micromonosporaceae bacterium B7E4]